MKFYEQLENLKITSIEVIPSKMFYEEGNIYVVVKQSLPRAEGYGEESQIIHRFNANTLEEAVKIAIARATAHKAIRDLCPDYMPPLKKGE